MEKDNCIKPVFLTILFIGVVGLMLLIPFRSDSGNITTAETNSPVAVTATATNKEPVEINFSVRLRLADGETNKNNK